MVIWMKKFICSLQKVILRLYVDDVLVIGTNEDDIVAIKQFLHSQITINDLGYAKYFLGFEITHSTTSIYVN